MKLFPILATASVLALSASGAFAQNAFSGSVGATYIKAFDDSFDYQFQADGSLTYAISPAFSAQLDLGVTHYEGNSNSDIDATLHGIYGVNDNLDIGVFFASNFGDFNNGVVGAEIGYRSGNLDLEAFFAAYVNNPGVNYNAGAKAGYIFDGVGSIPELELYAGYAAEVYSSYTIDNPYIGVKMGVMDNVDVDIRYAPMENNEYRYLSVGVSYNFGGGSRFTARDFNSTFPGY